MRLVEKKCPNCGAGLKFNDNDTNVVCEYCNKTYYIQKDEKKSAKVDDAHYADAFKFVNEVGKPIFKAFAFMHFVVPVIAFVIITIVMLISIFSFNRVGFDNRNDILDEFEEHTETFFDKSSDYVTKLSQIDQTSLETFNDTSLSRLGTYWDNSDNYKQEKNWEPCGVYLLVSKDRDDNILYDVFKKTFTGNGKTIEIFAAVEYTDLKLSEDNIVNNNYMGFVKAPMLYLDGNEDDMFHGYENNAKLYNQLIRSQSGEYSIQASEGLYMEES